MCGVISHDDGRPFPALPCPHARRYDMDRETAITLSAAALAAARRLYLPDKDAFREAAREAFRGIEPRPVKERPA